MAIERDTLLTVAGLLSLSDGVREAAQAIRQRFAELRVTVVDALDMRDEQPAFSVDSQRGPVTVFLVASYGHCWSLTRDATQANGLLLAHG